MKILVIGGAGFIGSNFIKHMLSKYDDVIITNFDLLTYAGGIDNIRDLEKNAYYRFVHGDIRKREQVQAVLKAEYDALINFAAETHVDRSVISGDSFVQTNTYGTFILLDAARKFNVDKFIQISTDEVYGSIRNGRFTETSALNPSSPYSASKASADLVALAFHRTYGFPVTVTRASNNYGPFQYPEKFIPKLILRALSNMALPIYGDGTQIRDWLFVEDNCEAIDLILRKGKPGEIYNVASGEEHMNIDVAKAILRILDKPESLLKMVSDRPGHDQRYSLDTSRIQRLGWKCKNTFADGLRKTIDWYREETWWWQPKLKEEIFEVDTPWELSKPNH